MSPTFNSFVKCSEVLYLSLNTMCYSVEQSYGVFEDKKRKFIAKTNNRVPERS